MTRPQPSSFPSLICYTAYPPASAPSKKCKRTPTASEMPTTTTLTPAHFACLIAIWALDRTAEMTRGRIPGYCSRVSMSPKVGDEVLSLLERVMVGSGERDVGSKRAEGGRRRVDWGASACTQGSGVGRAIRTIQKRIRQVDTAPLRLSSYFPRILILRRYTRLWGYDDYDTLEQGWEDVRVG
ncbi:hypothetical protein DFP72DRAFT_852003 [Ephemerocybe angulata]|uniref:Uncharacterized protein n=1 Tax=Ephemerocybe angulata TaxID=980116 RepID=A0A8H6HN06_9AGAR|nr:hypothetical protein DFP72DRAFT_852003 [Tulosesus angulatus]